MLESWLVSFFLCTVSVYYIWLLYCMLSVMLVPDNCSIFSVSRPLYVLLCVFYYCYWTVKAGGLYETTFLFLWVGGRYVYILPSPHPVWSGIYWICFVWYYFMYLDTISCLSFSFLQTTMTIFLYIIILDLTIKIFLITIIFSFAFKTWISMKKIRRQVFYDVLLAFDSLCFLCIT